MSFLVLSQLQKTYPDGTRAVHGVDLSVERGEFIVLLGPSGCGKTTTLRMVAGLELATAGTVQLDGREVTGLPPSQRDVGFVFQFYALYPHLRVRDNIAFPLVADGVAAGERARRVAEVAEAVGVSALLECLPRQLSGGDQQRVSLARALVRRPRLWLMDEPLGTLDAAVRQSLGAFIREQQRRHGVTTLFVTHDQDEAMHLADRVVVMEAGYVRQVGTPTAVYDRPANRFVAHFVGSPGMNFLTGEIQQDAFVQGELRIPTSDAPSGPLQLGIRPEWLRLSESGLAARVVLDEFQGDHRLLHLQIGAERLIARIPPAVAHAPGSSIRIAFEPAGVRWFDIASGAAR